MKAKTCLKPKRKLRKCGNCEKKFLTEFCFRLHWHVHESKTNAWFSCHACDRKFSQVTRLLKHRLIHPLAKKKDNKKEVKKRKKSKHSKAKEDSVIENHFKPMASFDHVVSNIKQEQHDVIETEPPWEAKYNKNSESDDELGSGNIFAKFGLIGNYELPGSDDVVKSNLQVRLISSYECELDTNAENLHVAASENSIKVNDNTTEIHRSTGSPYNCNDCGMTFTREVALHKHFELNHARLSNTDVVVPKGINPIQCGICGRTFTARKNLKVHEKVHDERKPFECSVCGYASKRKDSLVRHKKTCRPMKANIVKKVADQKKVLENVQQSSKIDMQVHQNKSHNEGLYSGSDLTKGGTHQNRIHNDIINSYVLTHEGYGRKFRLEDIMDLSGPDKGTHTCSFCNKVFTYKTSLKQHLRVHSSETPYQCKICKERFALRRQCRRHILKHLVNDMQKKDKQPCSVSKSPLTKGSSSVSNGSSSLTNASFKISASENHATGNPGKNTVSPVAKKPEKRKSVANYSEQLADDSDESFANTSDGSPDHAKVEDTLSESEIKKILGEEDIFVRKKRKRKQLNYFDGNYLFEEEDSDAMANHKSKDIFLRNGLWRRKCRRDASSALGVKEPKELKTKNKLVQKCLGLITSSEDESGSDEKSNKDDEVKRNRRMLRKRETKTAKRRSTRKKPQRQITLKDKNLSDNDVVSDDDERETSNGSNFSLPSSDVSDSENQSDWEPPSRKRNLTRKRRSSSNGEAIVCLSTEEEKEGNMEEGNEEDDNDDHGEEGRRLEHGEKERSDDMDDYSPVHKAISTSIDQHESAEELPFRSEKSRTKLTNKYVSKSHQVFNGHSEEFYECSYCDRIYSNVGDYEKHMHVHNHRDKMVCKICNKKLLTLTSYRAHKKMHKNNPIMCKICNEFFPSESKLEEHYSKAHDEHGDYRCKHCCKTFELRANYLRHLNEHINGRQFVCRICNFSFNILSDLARHVRQSHRDEQLLKPKGKDDILASKRKQEQVSADNDNIDEGKALDSDGTAMQRDGASQGGLTQEQRPSELQCKKCNKVCETQNGLHFHNLYAHRNTTEEDRNSALVHYVINNEAYICQLCGSNLKGYTNVLRHMRHMHTLRVTHGDIAAIPGEDVPRRRDIQTGTKDDDDFNNSLASERAASDEDLPDIELASVTGSSRRSKQSTPRKEIRSLESSTTKPTYMCNFCNAEFFNQTSRDLHVKKSHKNVQQSHTKIKAKVQPSIKCSLCGRKYVGKGKLKNHLNYFHKIPEGLEDALMMLTSSMSTSDSHMKSSIMADNIEKGKLEDTGHRQASREIALENTTEKRNDSEMKENGNLDCRRCGANLKSVDQLKDHISKCKKLVNGVNYGNHVNNSDPHVSNGVETPPPHKHSSKRTPDYYCHVCDIVFYHPRGLENHKFFSSAHAKIGLMKCPSCMDTIHAKDFEAHPCTKLNAKCSICDVRFANKHSVNRHIKYVHSNHKDFSCEKCGKSFNQKNYINRHRCPIELHFE